MKMPDLKDAATRMRMIENAIELAGELPPDDGEALATLAMLLIAKADACDALVAVQPLVAGAMRCYGTSMYTTGPETPRKPASKPRRVSARRGRK